LTIRLLATIRVYLHHNANALFALLQINVRELLLIDASPFLTSA